MICKKYCWSNFLHLNDWMCRTLCHLKQNKYISIHKSYDLIAFVMIYQLNTLILFYSNNTDIILNRKNKCFTVTINIYNVIHIYLFYRSPNTQPLYKYDMLVRSEHRISLGYQMRSFRTFIVTLIRCAVTLKSKVTDRVEWENGPTCQFL